MSLPSMEQMSAAMAEVKKEIALHRSSLKRSQKKAGVIKNVIKDLRAINGAGGCSSKSRQKAEQRVGVAMLALPPPGPTSSSPGSSKQQPPPSGGRARTECPGMQCNAM